MAAATAEDLGSSLEPLAAQDVRIACQAVQIGPPLLRPQRQLLQLGPLLVREGELAVAQPFQAALEDLQLNALYLLEAVLDGKGPADRIGVPCDVPEHHP